MTRILVCRAVLLVAHGVAFAGGALVGRSDGIPVGWATAARVLYSPDQGNLGRLAKDEVVARIENFVHPWEEVSTATIAFARGGALAVDVDASNFGAFLGPFAGATPPWG